MAPAGKRAPAAAARARASAFGVEAAASGPRSVHAPSFCPIAATGSGRRPSATVTAMKAVAATSATVALPVRAGGARGEAGWSDRDAASRLRDFPWPGSVITYCEAESEQIWPLWPLAGLTGLASVTGLAGERGTMKVVLRMPGANQLAACRKYGT